MTPRPDQVEKLRTDQIPAILKVIGKEILLKEKIPKMIIMKVWRVLARSNT